MTKYKSATSAKGTTYTQQLSETGQPLKPGQFKLSGAASGLLDTITPGNSYYTIYRGSTVPPETAPFSQDSYNAHLNNVRTLKFEQSKDLWEALKEYINSLSKETTEHKQGGNLKLKQNLLKYISGNN